MMTKIYEYVVSVTKRFPDKSKLDFSQPQLLAHDIRYDIEHNRLYDYTDEQLLYHINASLHDVEFETTFKAFKRNYRAWHRRRDSVK